MKLLIRDFLLYVWAFFKGRLAVLDRFSFAEKEAFFRRKDEIQNKRLQDEYNHLKEHVDTHHWYVIERLISIDYIYKSPGNKSLWDINQKEYWERHYFATHPQYREGGDIITYDGSVAIVDEMRVKEKYHSDDKRWVEIKLYHPGVSKSDDIRFGYHKSYRCVPFTVVHGTCPHPWNGAALATCTNEPDVPKEIYDFTNTGRNPVSVA